MNVMDVLAAHGLAGKSVALPKDLKESIETMWEVNGLDTGSTTVFPEVDDDNSFYMTYSQKWTKKFSPNDGSVVWTVPLNFVVTSTCIGQDGFYYVFGETKCLKINRTTGAQTEIVFSFSYPFSIGQGTVDKSGDIYVGGTYNSKEIIAKLSPTGSMVWRHEIGTAYSISYYGIIFFESHIYSHQGGAVYKLTSNGSLVWVNSNISLRSVIPDPLDAKCLLSVSSPIGSSFVYVIRVDVSGSSDPVIKNRQEIPTSDDSRAGRMPRLRVIKDAVYAAVGSYGFKLRLSDLYLFGLYRDSTAPLKGVLSDSTFYSLPAKGLRRVKFSYKIL
ncbi:hypothetical protein NDK47_24005 [Brevibacillus ruminantium]|uniref:Uncharacterized protein n=1 Tax=Brevibacillus ruminantium TaxID=2950604 RepID=A0ABY4WD84_9BACL|nr:hypothetical protein [Brevibacillus ruminantium]USG65150.1 hypothetical protein NDK47_24005 [Brevibacillus ruminantium]